MHFESYADLLTKKKKKKARRTALWRKMGGGFLFSLSHVQKIFFREPHWTGGFIIVWGETSFVSYPAASGVVNIEGKSVFFLLVGKA